MGSRSCHGSFDGPRIHHLQMYEPLHSQNEPVEQSPPEGTISVSRRNTFLMFWALMRLGDR